jgi:SSS family solute:Na+ symporter
MDGIKTTELVIFVFFFLVVTAMGFYAARWRRPTDLMHLDEWGLGGRKFGSWVTWFLVGGDLYTAYTFVAVPALMFGRAQPDSSPCRTRSSCTRSSS